MRTLSLRHLAVVALVVAPALAGAAPKPVTVLLHFIPEVSENPAALEASSSKPLRVDHVADARGLADPTIVGQNIQNPAKPVPVRAFGLYPGGPSVDHVSFVTDFATQVLLTMLSGWGVKIDPNADLVLKSEVLTYFVTEANDYKGEARFKFRLEDRAGQILWEGIAAADDFTWGHDLSPENYNLVLANLLKKVYANLMTSTGFAAGWSGRSTVPLERISLAEAKANITRMLNEGMAPDVIAEYVRGKRIVPGLTPDQMLEWKKEGIPESVIKAAVEPRKE